MAIAWWEGNTGVYGGLTEASAAAIDGVLAGLDTIAAGLEQGLGMARFFRASASYLPELLRDAVSLQALLFADGDSDVVHDVCQRNLSSRNANAVAAVVIAEFADSRPELRVVELGSGIGGTTVVVIDALQGKQVDYLLTDLTRSFLTSHGRQSGTCLGCGVDCWTSTANAPSRDTVRAQPMSCTQPTTPPGLCPESGTSSAPAAG
ncbi:hypothetical protein BCF44_12617 [Kutzneria buriramensis]|uniref:Methyltransferase family protein n=1 Tax=Kutzneria buriramensis TaxID=1045776 RepID=A0A3E0GWT3_9PSEU|nr:hypothetical protein BCF44_12617 [Kutzneria buriramensis]